jgi:hypothetical protein
MMMEVTQCRKRLHQQKVMTVKFAFASTVLTAFYLLTEHFVDASRKQMKRVYELSGPFGPQTTKTRRQAWKVEGGVRSC